jgi:peptide/nickel transport system substrate-binding protein
MRARRVTLRGVAFVSAALLAALALGGSAAAQDGSEEDEGKSTDWRLAFDVEIDFEANPFAAFNASPYFIYSVVYDKLLNYDLETGAPDLENSLATGYERSDDGLVYTFTLREDARWADGEPFNADDVVWTYNEVATTDNVLIGYLVNMDKVEKVDDYTVRVTLTKPDARIPSIYVPILPEHIWSKAPSEPETDKIKEFKPCCPMIGTGAYYIPGPLNKKGTTILEPNPYFYGPKGGPKRILMTKYEDKEAQLRDIKLNLVDAILSGDESWVANARKDVNLEAFGTPQPGFTEIAFNMCPPGGASLCTGPGEGANIEVVQDLAIRQALQWAIDRDTLVRVVYRGQATRGNGLISPYYARFYQSFEGDPEVGYTYDPDKAREILADGGWDCPTGGICTKNGVRAEFELLVRSINQAEQQAARRIKAWAREVGIEINLSIVTEDAINAEIYNPSPEDESLYAPTYDAFLWGWSGDIGAPDFNLEVLQCESGWTDSFYCNPEYDEAALGALTELDPQRRVELIHEAERIALKESPYVILVHDGIVYVHRNDTWTNYIRQPAPDGDPYGNSWLQMVLLEPGEKASTNYSGAPFAMGLLFAGVAAVVGFSFWRRRREDSGPRELPEPTGTPTPARGAGR